MVMKNRKRTDLRGDVAFHLNHFKEVLNLAECALWSLKGHRPSSRLRHMADKHVEILHHIVILIRETEGKVVDCI